MAGSWQHCAATTYYPYRNLSSLCLKYSRVMVIGVSESKLTYTVTDSNIQEAYGYLQQDEWCFYTRGVEQDLCATGSMTMCNR
jgi:hypothetical protein